jgi:activating signal cointegrator complex subunit 3
VIKGTDVYNPEKGGNVDLSILDVMQIFGRAGRPQFDSSGEATLITTLDSFPNYMNKLVRPVPIESNFIKHLADHLNAEIVGRTVTNIQEAATWLTYTYLYVRMLRNPLAYGINTDEKTDDPMLRKRCLVLVTDAAKLLDSFKMIRFDPGSGNLGVANTGRVAAHFYIQAESIETFNDMFERKSVPNDIDLCRIVCSATEFRNMKLRQEELEELQDLEASACPLRIAGAGDAEDGRNVLITDSADKTFVLLQAFISRAKIKSFTLISDMNYINANAGRIVRALFEISLKKQEATATVKLLRIAKSIEKQIWFFQTPLRVFEDELGQQVYTSLEGLHSGHYDTFEFALSLLDMQANEVGQLCRAHRGGGKIQHFVSLLPRLEATCKVHPVTRSVLRFEVTVEAAFTWVKRWHGGVQSFWVFVEDPDANRIYHHEYVTFSLRTYRDPITLDMLIPAFESFPEQYTLRIISETFVGVETVLPVSLRGQFFRTSVSLLIID